MAVRLLADKRMTEWERQAALLTRVHALERQAASLTEASNPSVLLNADSRRHVTGSPQGSSPLSTSS